MESIAINFVNELLHELPNNLSLHLRKLEFSEKNARRSYYKSISSLSSHQLSNDVFERCNYIVRRVYSGYFQIARYKNQNNIMKVFCYLQTVVFNPWGRRRKLNLKKSSKHLFKAFCAFSLWPVPRREHFQCQRVSGNLQIL